MSGYFLEISWDTILICGMQLSQNQEKDLLYRRKIQKGTNLTINNYQENVPSVFWGNKKTGKVIKNQG